MIRTARKEAFMTLSASHEFEAIRQFMPPEMYDYFSVVLKLTHIPARQ